MPPTAKKKTAASFTTDWKSNKASSTAIKKFEETFSKEMGLGVLSRKATITPYAVIPTGSLALDYALGIGGLPVGRIVEIWGPEHAGKTTEACLAIASAQRTQPEKMTAWVDAEQTFDKKWAQKLGVDLTRMWLVENPKTAEDVADALKRFVMSGLCSLVVVDSIGSMIGKVEFEKESEDSVVAIVAKIVTRMVKQIASMGHSNGTTTMVVNQVRAVVGGNVHGPKTQSSGGWALRHVTSVRLSVRRGESKSIKVDGNEIPVAHQVITKVEKNKCAPYGRTATFWLYNTPTDSNDIGVDPIGEVIEFGKRMGIIEGSTWLTLPNGQRFNGAPKTAEYLEANPEVVAEIRERVLAGLAGIIHEESEDEAADPTGLLAYLESDEPKDAKPFGDTDTPAEKSA